MLSVISNNCFQCPFIPLKTISLLLSRIAECFAFLVCTKWSNPMIHRDAHRREPGSSSNAIRYREWSSGLVLPSFEDQPQERLCGLPDIGGHIMKIPLVVFQVLLCMHLEVIYIFPAYIFFSIHYFLFCLYIERFSVISLSSLFHFSHVLFLRVFPLDIRTKEAIMIQV